METKVSRTLVKSAPELWELLDDERRMQSWSAAVLGSGNALTVEVTAREPERFVVWRASDGRASGSIALELAEKGFGTSVAITARHDEGAPGSAALENLLDELGSPERQPFAGA
jgi:hypothetical protein